MMDFARQKKPSILHGPVEAEKPPGLAGFQFVLELAGLAGWLAVSVPLIVKWEAPHKSPFDNEARDNCVHEPQ